MNVYTRTWLIFLSLALFGAACRSPKPAGSSKSAIKLCYAFVSGTQLVVQYAKEKGIFAEYGLDVELTQTGRGAKAAATLIAGEVQVCQVAGASVIHAAAAGEDV
ncbi:MAG TPA: ABC transporter substrate-binding protein, partial [Blastocatellia bacterium]|nr:ABC transporter substrate-binding protein [Blastocatellia bacterium]